MEKNRDKDIAKRIKKSGKDKESVKRTKKSEKDSADNGQKSHERDRCGHDGHDHRHKNGIFDNLTVRKVLTSRDKTILKGHTGVSEIFPLESEKLVTDGARITFEPNRILIRGQVNNIVVYGLADAIVDPETRVATIKLDPTSGVIHHVHIRSFVENGVPVVDKIRTILPFLNELTDGYTTEVTRIQSAADQEPVALTVETAEEDGRLVMFGHTNSNRAEPTNVGEHLVMVHVPKELGITSVVSDTTETNKNSKPSANVKITRNTEAGDSNFVVVGSSFDLALPGPLPGFATYGISFSSVTFPTPGPQTLPVNVSAITHKGVAGLFEMGPTPNSIRVLSPDAFRYILGNATIHILQPVVIPGISFLVTVETQPSPSLIANIFTINTPNNTVSIPLALSTSQRFPVGTILSFSLSHPAFIPGVTGVTVSFSPNYLGLTRLS
jgi:hypothetical protein